MIETTLQVDGALYSARTLLAHHLGRIWWAVVGGLYYIPMNNTKFIQHFMFSNMKNTLWLKFIEEGLRKLLTDTLSQNQFIFLSIRISFSHTFPLFNGDRSVANARLKFNCETNENLWKKHTLHERMPERGLHDSYTTQGMAERGLHHSYTTQGMAGHGLHHSYTTQGMPERRLHHS